MDVHLLLLRDFHFGHPGHAPLYTLDPDRSSELCATLISDAFSFHIDSLARLAIDARRAL